MQTASRIARRRRRRRQVRCRGQTLVEYGLILAMISIVAILVLQSTGTRVTQLYTKINTEIEKANSQSY